MSGSGRGWAQREAPPRAQRAGGGRSRHLPEPEDASVLPGSRPNARDGRRCQAGCPPRRRGAGRRPCFAKPPGRRRRSPTHRPGLARRSVPASQRSPLVPARLCPPFEPAGLRSAISARGSAPISRRLRSQPAGPHRQSGPASLGPPVRARQSGPASLVPPVWARRSEFASLCLWSGSAGPGRQSAPVGPGTVCARRPRPAPPCPRCRPTSTRKAGTISGWPDLPARFHGVSGTGQRENDTTLGGIVSLCRLMFRSVVLISRFNTVVTQSPNADTNGGWPGFSHPFPRGIAVVTVRIARQTDLHA